MIEINSVWTKKGTWDQEASPWSGRIVLAIESSWMGSDVLVLGDLNGQVHHLTEVRFLADYEEQDVNSEWMEPWVEIAAPHWLEGTAS